MNVTIESEATRLHRLILTEAQRILTADAPHLSLDLAIGVATMRVHAPVVYAASAHDACLLALPPTVNPDAIMGERSTPLADQILIDALALVGGATRLSWQPA